MLNHNSVSTSTNHQHSFLFMQLFSQRTLTFMVHLCCCHSATPPLCRGFFSFFFNKAVLQRRVNTTIEQSDAPHSCLRAAELVWDVGVEAGWDACPGQEEKVVGRTDGWGSEKTGGWSSVCLSFTVCLQNASVRLFLPAFQHLIFHKQDPITSTEDFCFWRVRNDFLKTEKKQNMHHHQNCAWASLKHRCKG